MSKRLAIAAAFSVLLMALFTLFGEHTLRVPFGPDSFNVDAGSALPRTPDVSGLLPALR
jgi:hypothetical protein